MADDNSFRSRIDDDVNSPLAELARLIGQPDPYVDQVRTPAPRREQGGGWRETAAALAREAMRQQTEPAAEPGFDDDAPVRDTPRPGRRVGPAALQAVFADRSYSEPAYTEPHAEEAFGDAPPAAARQSYHDRDRHEPAYDGPPGHEAYGHEAHGGEGAAAADHGDENYFFDDTAPRDGSAEAEYDDPPRARTPNGLVTAAVLIGCALFGTAAAYGYRTYYTGAHSGNAPIISADNGPIKVVPAPASGDNQSGKAIHDRVGDTGGERMVSHQEEPVQLGDAGNAHVVLPAPFTSVPGSGQGQIQGQGQGQGQIATSTPGLAQVPPPADAKKVRTVAIRPDGSEVAPRVNAAASPPPQNQPIQLSPPSVNAAPPPPPAPPVAAAPKTARAAATARADAPLTLVPTEDAPAPRERSAQPQLASVPNSAAAGYVVQVSSQRSEADALASYKSLQTKFPRELGDRPAFVRRADLGQKGVYYRALVGPFGSAGDADQLCGDLKAAGGQCIVQRN